MPHKITESDRFIGYPNRPAGAGLDKSGVIKNPDVIDIIKEYLGVESDDPRKGPSAGVAIIFNHENGKSSYLVAKSNRGFTPNAGGACEEKDNRYSETAKRELLEEFGGKFVNMLQNGTLNNNLLAFNNIGSFGNIEIFSPERIEKISNACESLSQHPLFDRINQLSPEDFEESTPEPGISLDGKTEQDSNWKRKVYRVGLDGVLDKDIDSLLPLLNDIACSDLFPVAMKAVANVNGLDLKQDRGKIIEIIGKTGLGDFTQMGSFGISPKKDVDTLLGLMSNTIERSKENDHFFNDEGKPRNIPVMESTTTGPKIKKAFKAGFNDLGTIPPKNNVQEPQGERQLGGSGISI